MWQKATVEVRRGSERALKKKKKKLWCNLHPIKFRLGFPGGSVVRRKKTQTSPANAGDTGSAPGSPGKFYVHLPGFKEAIKAEFCCCSLVSNSFVTPMDCSPPGSSVHARILEWVAISFSRGSSWSRDWTCVSYVSCTGRSFLYHWPHLGSSLNSTYLYYHWDD